MAPTSTTGSPVSQSRVSTSWIPSQLRIPPPLRTRVEQLVARVAHLDGRRREDRLGRDEAPESTGGDHVVRHLGRRRIASREADDRADPGGPDGVERPSRLGRGAGRRLVDDQVDPGPGQALDRGRRVGVGERDERHVEGVARDQVVQRRLDREAPVRLAEAGTQRRVVVGRCQRASQLGIRVVERDDLELVRESPRSSRPSP